MPKYKVCYSGFIYIEADDKTAAIDRYEFGGFYEERKITSVEEVDEFVVTPE